MTRSRARKVDYWRLDDLLTSRDEIDVLRERLRQFEELRREGTLQTPFIALEALSALACGRETGYSDANLRRAWPEEWGDQTVEVPFALLHALASAWIDYRDDPDGRSLERAFRLGRKNKGEHTAIAKLRTIDRHRALAHAVNSDYVAAAALGNPKSLDDIFHEVADQYGSNYDTVWRAHARYGKYAWEQLKQAGVLKGGKR